MSIILQIVGSLALLGIGLGLGFVIKNHLLRQKRQAAEEESGRLLTKARTEAREITLSAKDEALRIREKVEQEAQRKRDDLHRQEERLQKRREELEHRLDGLEERERRSAQHLEEREQKLAQRQNQLNQLEQEVQELHKRRSQELQRISGLTREEARELFLEEVSEEARRDAARRVREVEMQSRAEVERRAREIITTAIQRLASDQVEETTTSLVELPSDDMKGRIIGRNGRNIRAFEKATGVNVVVDDTPEAVLLSCYDPIRREIARVAMSRLVLDGRIHPGRIERMVAQAQQEVEAIIEEEGQNAVHETDLVGLHPELVRLLGQLKFRTSYGQNVLDHSIEAAFLAAMMAEELGADEDLAREGGLLHDIGKAVDHQVDGSHAAIGADIARRLGTSEEVVNCIAAHHGEVEPICPEAILVEAADAISGARPGARRENLERYLKHLKTLERLANSFEGVEESYAIQAGREIRIIVKPDQIDDWSAINLSKEIASKVEESLEYPGQIKVTVIREVRAVEYAQ
ncbi:MAG: ribonuclease Y [Chloroflexota bacterium]|nr:ribonuclease Y [Chloroflexota bacterium]